MAFQQIYNDFAMSIRNCSKADKFPTEMNMFHNNFEKQRQTAIKTEAETETGREKENVTWECRIKVMRIWIDRNRKREQHTVQQLIIAHDS